MLAFIVQARLGSTRFPNKVRKIIYEDKTVLDLCLENLKPLGYKIIVATTANPKDNEIIEIAERNMADWFRGSEENVLERYVLCAEEFGVSQIIRITSDNIFVQSQLIKKIIDAIKPNLDYISYMIGNKNVVLTHWGLFGEYVTLNALKKVLTLNPSIKSREHVTYHIYTHQKSFNVKYLPVPSELNRTDIRLTIDTIGDYKICKQIYGDLRKKKVEPTYINIIEYLDQNPAILSKMDINIKEISK